MTLKYSQDANLPDKGYAITGYDLVGWIDANDSTKRYGLGQTIRKLAGEEYGTKGENKEITLNAVWRPKQFDIKFIRNDINQNNGSTLASLSVAGVDIGHCARAYRVLACFFFRTSGNRSGFAWHIGGGESYFHRCASCGNGVIHFGRALERSGRFV